MYTNAHKHTSVSYESHVAMLCKKYIYVSLYPSFICKTHHKGGTTGSNLNLLAQLSICLREVFVSAFRERVSVETKLIK